MDKLQLSHIKHIKEASLQGRLVIFVGAGVSANSGVPTWGSLIDQLKKELGLENESDDLKIAQLYKDGRGEKEYMDKIKMALKHNMVAPNAIHKCILDLNPCHIITTNYDNLIEQEIESEFKQFAVVREDKDIPNMLYPNSLIKMHGDFETNNIVLSESDYYNYQKNFPLIRSFVMSLFASKLVVFVGFSFADLNLKMLLNDLHSVLKDSMQRVYLLSDSAPSSVMSRYYENKGINVVHLGNDDIEELLPQEVVATESQLKGKGLYLYKLLSCIYHCDSDREKRTDIVSTLYHSLVSINDEISVLGNRIKYIIPQKESSIFFHRVNKLKISSPYLKELQHLKPFSGLRKFVTDNPDIDFRLLKDIAFKNSIYQINDITIIDKQKQNQTIENSVFKYFYMFDFENLSKRILELSSRDAVGDSSDLEYPFLLYKLGNYYEAYQIYNRILPVAWKRKKFILYFICLYNLYSIRWKIHQQLILQNAEVAQKIFAKLDAINLDEVLSRLPISEGIRKSFQDLLSYRSLGKVAIDSEDKREELYHQRKDAERGGWSINSNIYILLSQFEQEYKYNNLNYIASDCNEFYKTICYNTICGLLNSHATTSNAIGLMGGISPTKIEELDSICLFAMIFHQKSKELQDIFNRYEIENIKLSSEALETINNCWKNLSESNSELFTDKGVFLTYLDNLVFLTSRIEDERLNSEHIYKGIIKHWANARSCNLHDRTFSILLERIKPDAETVKILLNLIIDSLDKHSNAAAVISDLVQYLKEFGISYNLSLDKVTKYTCNSLYPLYEVLDGHLQSHLSKLCQEHLCRTYSYLWFLNKNNLPIISEERFEFMLTNGEELNNPYVCKLLSKMYVKEVFSNVHHVIETCKQRSDCLRFFLAPLEYENKQSIDAEWLFRFTDDEFIQIAGIEEYRQVLKHYLIENGGKLSKQDRDVLIGRL